MTTLDSIANEMIKRLGYDFRTIKGRKQQDVWVRSLFYKLSREYTTETYNEIGKYLNKDHATVLHGANLFHDVVAANSKNLKRIYYNIKEVLDFIEVKETLQVIDVNILTYGIKTN